MLLHHRFIDRAKENGKKIAVHDLATGASVSYKKMLVASLALTAKFNQYDGRNIGILLPASLAFHLSVLTSLLIGKVPVIINYSTGAYKNSIFAQEKCYFKTIITSRKLLEKLEIDYLDGAVYIEDILKTLNLADKLKAAFIALFPANFIKDLYHKCSENDDAAILFTSGSEKEPKAVQLSHKNIAHNIINVQPVLQVTADDVYMGCLPLFHVFGLTVDFWLPLLTGASVISMPNPLDYKAICYNTKRYKATVIASTPTFLYGYAQKVSPGDFSSIRIAISGADKLTSSMRQIIENKLGVKISEGYGTTETSPIIAVNTPHAGKIGSVGKPLPAVKVKIVDINTDAELEANKIGRILVKGDLVMKGYFGDFEQTLMRIHNGWYDTGDLGSLDNDGYLYHHGRLRRYVKIGSEMVSLAQVEEALEKVLPHDVAYCAVGIPNPIKGSQIIVALTTDKLNSRQIKKQLANYLDPLSIPKDFIYVESIPTGASGKVDFRSVEKFCQNHYKN